MTDAYETAGMQRLWVSVLRQQIIDAFIDPTLAQTTDGHTLRTRDDARDWLTGAMVDFMMVCHFAGFNPAKVRSCARRWARDGWPRSAYDEAKALAAEAEPFPEVV